MRLFLSCILVVLIGSSCNCNHKSGAAAGKDSVLYNQAVAPLTDAIQSDPKKADNYYKRGNLLHKMQFDSLALTDFKKAVSLDSSRAEYYSAIGDLLFEHRDITGSVSWLQNALKRNQMDVKAHLKLAKVMIFMGEYPKAFAEVNTVLRNDTYNPEGYFLKGIIYKELKDTLKAISSFQTSINVAPDYKEAMLQLGLLYNLRNDPVGMKYLDNAFQLDTTDLFPLYAKGKHYQDVKDYEKAKAEYRNCINHDPQYSTALFAMGFVLIQQDSFQSARRQFDLVTKIEPNNPDAYYNRGLCSELMNQKTDAGKDYEQALVFDKDNQNAKDGLKRINK